MTWSTSNRRDELPKDWGVIRRGVLERDAHSCQWPLSFGGVCGQPANEVDHRYSPTDHNPHSLWSLCPYHHMRKTAGESHAGRRGQAKRKRNVEQHPGARRAGGG